MLVDRFVKLFFCKQVNLSFLVAFTKLQLSVT